MNNAQLATSILTMVFLLTPSWPIQAQQKNLRLADQKVDSVTRWPNRDKRYALLIGVNSYEDNQITPLIGAVNDMKILEEALVDHCGFDRDRVIRLTGEREDSSLKPTYRNAYTRLSNILKAVPEDGLLVLAFSGHGIERNGRAFLLPTDASVNGDIELLERTALEVASIKRMIEARRDSEGQPRGLAQVLLLLDACRNDPTSGKDLSVNALTKAYDFNLRNSKVQAFATIYATSRGYRAYENKARKQGYFIGEVVAGLSGGAINESGEVTLDQLIRYVEDKVPTKVTLDLGNTQRPFMEMQGYKASELVIAYHREAAGKRPIGDERREREEPRIAEPAVLKPVIPLPSKVRPEALAVLNFMTARVESNGKVNKFPGEPTQQYIEDLGRGVTLEMVPVRGDGVIKDFWMGKYEVTQEQWNEVMGTGPSYFKGGRLPVESVSWNDVKEFCQRLNRKLGLSDENGYRLPAEAEWEYAARAGTVTEFAFGDTISPEIVNYDGNYPYGEAPKGVYRGKTVDVGSLGVANGWGLYDMHGNVWEWCEDEMAASRVNRGGGWIFNAINCRSANRDRYVPGFRSASLGFRLSRTLP